MTKAKDDKALEQADEKIDALSQDQGDLKLAPDQVKEAIADLELQKEKTGEEHTTLTDEEKFGDANNPLANVGADQDKVPPVDPLKVQIVDEDGDDTLTGGLHGLKEFDGDESRILSEEEVLRRQGEGFDEYSSDIEAGTFTVHAPVPSEEVPFEPIEDVRAVKHASHSAAMTGLQTDASGSYTPPGIAGEPKSTFTQ